MEPKVSLPSSQEPDTGPYSERDESSTHLRSFSILSFHLCLGLPTGFFSLVFSTKILYEFLLSPMRVTFPAHLILLDFTTRTTFGEAYKLWSS